jgi:hypothetical protein
VDYWQKLNHLAHLVKMLVPNKLTFTNMQDDPKLFTHWVGSEGSGKTTLDYFDMDLGKSIPMFKILMPQAISLTATCAM